MLPSCLYEIRTNFSDVGSSQKLWGWHLKIDLANHIFRAKMSKVFKKTGGVSAPLFLWLLRLWIWSSNAFSKIFQSRHNFSKTEGAVQKLGGKILKIIVLLTFLGYFKQNRWKSQKTGRMPPLLPPPFWCPYFYVSSPDNLSSGVRQNDSEFSADCTSSIWGFPMTKSVTTCGRVNYFISKWVGFSWANYNGSRRGSIVSWDSSGSGNHGQSETDSGLKKFLGIS